MGQGGVTERGGGGAGQAVGVASGFGFGGHLGGRERGQGRIGAAGFVGLVRRQQEQPA
jgi:hypothetical protein